MKISFILPSNRFNGGTRVIGIVAAELMARGHDVQLFTQPTRRPSARQRVRTLLRDRRLLRTPKDGPFLDGVIDRVTRLERRRPVTNADLPDADAVIATWWETAHWVQRLSYSKGAKVYFMQDYGAPGQEIEKIARTWEMPFAFITLNARLRDMILECNPGASVAIMRNAVDHTLFNGAIRNRGRPPKIGLIYREKTSKGMDTALSALAEIRKQLPDVVAVAVSSRHEDLPAWIEQVHRPDDDTLRAVYRSCDLWLFPSRMEGFGLPIIEAMASRTPVVSTRVGGAPDVIEDGVNGHLVDIGDWKAMANKAISLLAGPEEDWNAMAEAAQATVANYTWSDAVDLFEDALNAAARRRQ